MKIIEIHYGNDLHHLHFRVRGALYRELVKIIDAKFPTFTIVTSVDSVDLANPALTFFGVRGVFPTKAQEISLYLKLELDNLKAQLTIDPPESLSQGSEVLELTPQPNKSN